MPTDDGSADEVAAPLPTLTWQPLVDVEALASTPLTGPQVAVTPAAEGEVVFQPMVLDAGRDIPSGAPTVAALPTTSTTTATPAPATGADDPITPLGAVSAIAPQPRGDAPVEFAPMTLNLGTASQPAASPPTASPAEADRERPETVASPPAAAPIELAPMTLTLEDGDPSPAVRDLAPSRPSAASPTASPPSPPTPPATRAAVAAPASAPAPEQVEVRSTPPTRIVPAIADDLPAPAGSVSAAPVADMPVMKSSTPAEPEVPFGTPVLPPRGEPDQRRSTPTPAAAAAPASAVARTTTRAGQKQKPRKRGRGLKIASLLVVLGALAAAGVVFGRPYFFPTEWDAATHPYAEQAETVLGVEFAEPLSIVAQPTAIYREGLVAQLPVPDAAEQAQWRALGLMSGELTAADVAGRLVAGPDAYYSSADGKVYVDEAAIGTRRDAALMQAMVAAALDQHVAWTAGQPQRSLDGVATTRAEVARLAAAAQTTSTFDGQARPLDPAALDGLPPIIEYRLLAPSVYAAFAVPAPVGVRGVAPTLADIAVSGPGPLRSDALALASPATTASGDVVTATPVATDRSFWYLLLASRLEAGTAFAATETMVESTLTVSDRAGVTCAYATFGGGGTDATATMRSTLDAWVAAGGPEYAAEVSELADGNLQLVSCDPGAGFAATLRPGAARELIGWRVAELSTLASPVVVDHDAPASAFTYVWPSIVRSRIATDVAAAVPSTAPADLAVVARQAVDAALAAG